MIEAELFKAVMAAAPGPAAVVTAMSADGEPCGLTVSAVCSVSLDPPLALACLDRGSNTLAAVRDSRAFTINYLAGGREELAMSFATKSDRKFDRANWTRPGAGAGGPILADDAAAYAVCRLEEIVEAGDHVILVGAVVEGGVAEEHHALAYARRAFFTGAQPDGARLAG
ncbi:flavin reductase family protein [Amycolatopsis sp. Poz14]|uniref:flavin reductase family protein n=1 Tax=Amycolatopsis sp. Poz14 TaxID=1447705 RepID=UPI001EE8AD8B|nr:flavin reductase family protein [Amycolatopsis sp. Poz14]MCG3754047.1 flavin reductase family protein [Amycolatopsis sp. Poz14]